MKAEYLHLTREELAERLAAAEAEVVRAYDLLEMARAENERLRAGRRSPADGSGASRFGVVGELVEHGRT